MKITIGADNDDKPPIPPTRHPMVNRLTSSIDESLVNLNRLSQDTEMEKERALYELKQLFLQLHTYLEKRFLQFENEIKSSYDHYDQHLYELKSRLKQVRQQLVQSFSSVQNHDNDNDDYTFDINKYRYLEMLTTETLNQTMKDIKILPKYQIKLNNIDQFDQFIFIQCEQIPSRIISQTDDRVLNDFSRETTPIQRSMSIGKYNYM
jgi:hypothetical protein